MAKTIQPPEVSLQMNYSEKESLLVVHVNRVTGLPRRTDGKPHNTYVKLFLVPKIAELLSRQARNSEIKREDNEPAFSQKVEYESMSTYELINSVLRIKVLEYSCFQKHQVLGEADLLLVHVHFVQGEATMTLPLDIPRKRENHGTILVSLAYMQDVHKLNVWLIKGKDLNKGNDKETDAQAKMWITMNGEQLLDEKYTKTVPSTASPCFNDEKFFWVLDPLLVKNIAIHVAILNRHPKCPEKRSELGHVTISKQQTSSTECMHWVNIINSPDQHITEWHELVKDEPARKEGDEPKVSLAQLSIHLEYKTVRETLAMKIERAHWCQDKGTLFSSFVRLAIIPQLPDTPPRADKRTNIIVAENSATFNEEIKYETMCPDEFYNSILQVELVDYDFIEESLVLGQKSMLLSEVPLVKGKAKLNLTLDPPMKRSSVLVSLAYNYEAETISVSLIMANDLNNKNNQETDARAKIQVTDSCEIYGELTTEKRSQTCAPVFRETLTCNLQESELRHVAINISIFNENSSAGSHTLGTVILCSQSSVGEALKHWNEFLSEPHKPNTYWYVLSQEKNQTSTIEVQRNSPNITYSNVLFQRSRNEHRLRSSLVTEDEKEIWKLRQRSDYKCKKAVFNMLQNIDKERPWSDIIEFPESIMEQIDTTSGHKKAELSLCLTYSEAAATLTVKIDKVLGLQCHVFADLAQERLARIAHRVPSHAITYLFLEPSLATVPLRKSKKTEMKKLAEETLFAEDIQFEAIGREELETSTLHVDVLGWDFENILVLGQTQLTLADVGVKGEEVATTVVLDQPIAGNLGSVRLSLLYQQETKELVVILLRAKDLNNRNSSDTDAQARIWITLDSDIILGETYSTTIEKSCSPYFNETLSVMVEPSKIRNVAILISVQNRRETASYLELGQVKLCSDSSGEEYRHWNDTITSPGDRLMEWHKLHAATETM